MKANTETGLNNELLLLEPEALNACVSCGLCLPYCPTYRVTGDERMSPRGRIALMRSAGTKEFNPTPEWIHSMDTCVQCRGCETACPSAVPFGELISDTKKALASVRKLPLTIRIGLLILNKPRLLTGITFFIWVLQKLGFMRNSSYIPSGVPLFKRQFKTTYSSQDPVLFTGCVMESWTPWVHTAALKTLAFFGVNVATSGKNVGCCGALHEHSGLRSVSIKMAENVMNEMPTNGPVLVNSAGCGAMLKEYGKLLGTEKAKQFSERVFDVHEWIAKNCNLPNTIEKKERLVVQDPCHLRHAQNSHQYVREVLSPFVEIVELPDEGLCCGAGGAFSVSQKKLSTEIRKLKRTAFAEVNTKGEKLRVVSANPGCVTHLQSEGFEIKHPLEVVAEYVNEISETDEMSKF